jgi:hypothetical protein
LSHSKERHEKICLNCNAELTGRYCHVCGQENIEPKETVWTLVSHFFYDITHFDGKFFSTTRYLVLRPGFLPKEYIAGRRARYLHPIRMYVFSSALFFLCLYSASNFHYFEKKKDKEAAKKDIRVARKALDSARIKALATAKDREDSAVVNNAFDVAIQPYLVMPAAENTDEDDDDGEVKAEKQAKKKEHKETTNINLIDPDEKFTTIKQYDSFQHTLPVAKRDGWFRRKLKSRSIELRERYGDNRGEMYKELLEKFTHTFPYLLFVSLPLYALYLSFLYWRRKQFLYVTHAIFLIYLYIFTFIDLLVFFGLKSFGSAMAWDWVGYLEVAVLLYGVWYAYRAMRKFYGQGTGKTLLKFFLLNMMSFVSIIILFIVFFLFAVFKF